MNHADLFKRHKRVLTLIFVVGVLLFFLKFWLYLITGSNSILSDALESIVNVVAGGFALYSLILSNKPSDKKHPYGHGKIEFLSASIEGAMIIAAGILIIVKSIYNFYFPSPIESLELGILFTAISGGINLFMGLTLVRMGKRVNSLLLRASGKHLASDSYTSAGLILGLTIIHFTHILWLDGVVAILFGLIIIYSGYEILKESIDGIMDGADFDTLDKLVRHLRTVKKDDWIDLHKMRMIKYGTFLHFDCHVTVPRYYTIEEGHQIIDKIEKEMLDFFSDQAEIFIHVDACIPQSCKYCSLSNCPVRSEANDGKSLWELEHVIQNKKHGLQEKK